MKLNLGAERNILLTEGWHNLDITTKFGAIIWKGWGNTIPYKNNTADLILVSHSLMFCPKELYKFVFKDIYRVLKRGAKFLLKEDNNIKYQWRKIGTHNIKSSTNLAEIFNYLVEAKFHSFQADPEILIKKYGNIINRQNKLLQRKIFIIESEK